MSKKTDSADPTVEELLTSVRLGEPTRVQCDPDERDPVLNETADDAWDSFQRNGLVNPFHAVELQRRQNEERAQQPCGYCGDPVGHNATVDGRYCNLMCAIEADEAQQPGGDENA